MIRNFKFVIIDSKYCNYLRKFDEKVIYNNSSKENRPFVGVLFNINEIEFFAPLSSPKPKHLKMKTQIDFYKIKDGKLGVINLNNMIPVNKKNYRLVDLNYLKNNKDYYFLLLSQLKYINNHKKEICCTVEKLYFKYKEEML